MTANRKFVLISLTLLLWAAGCCLYCYWFISVVPSEPNSENYGNPKFLAFLGFVIYRLPFLLLALFPILYLEAIICNLFLDKDENR